MKEFLEVKMKEKEEDKKRVTRYDLYKRINPDYYGFGDDDDGLLIPLEAAAEKRLRSNRIRRWRQKNGLPPEDAKKMRLDIGNETKAKPRWKSHVALPTKAEIEAAIVAKRKEILLAKYAGDTAEVREESLFSVNEREYLRANG